MNRKIEFFTEAIQQEVEARRRKAKHRLAVDLSSQAAEEVKSAEERVIERKKAVQRKLTRAANKKIAEVIKKEKYDYFIKRHSRKALILDSVVRKLKEFTNSAEYKDYLIESINKNKADFTTVLLCESDMRFAAEIQKATGLTPKVHEDFLGGFILQNKRVSADYTFKTRLERAAECIKF